MCFGLWPQEDVKRLGLSQVDEPLLEQIEKENQVATGLPVFSTWSSSSLLVRSRRGPLRRSTMTASESVSPHISWGALAVVTNLVQPSTCFRGRVVNALGRPVQ